VLAVAAWLGRSSRLAPRQSNPHIVLSVFLPPLLYADAWRARGATSALDPADPVRSPSGCGVHHPVLGVPRHWLMPELPWAVCFSSAHRVADRHGGGAQLSCRGCGYRGG